MAPSCGSKKPAASTPAGRDLTLSLARIYPEANLAPNGFGHDGQIICPVEARIVTEDIKSLLRLPPLSYQGEIDCVMFSGGVSEFIYNRAKTSFGDLGPLIAEEVHKRTGDLGLLVMEPTRVFVPPSSARRSTPCK